ncbi:hypothetical protein [Streptomyces albipurpureus]|uniref:Uncharacterized protein n=1 Tax=Streptomyces albipurpureus TaxID=2897419 RepID=A0ABT0UL70_9ACTN|nr:hypothetical protein [Streptomyces sp. CWNU-1]MCM2389352.1 hypothetical protein [Streptomyces sp. CWNU-1]
MSGKNVAEHQTPRLNVGELAYDTSKGALGVVMDTGTDAGDGRYALRPPQGGVEWSALCAEVRPATVADQLRPALAEMNTRSSGGSAWG